MKAPLSNQKNGTRIIKRKPPPNHAKIMRTVIEKLEHAPMDRSRYECLTSPERLACLELLGEIRAYIERPRKSDRYPRTFCYKGVRYEIGVSILGRACVYSPRTGNAVIWDSYIP